jgi:hypothetical protein
LRVVELERATSWADFLRDYPSDAQPEEIARVNGVDDPKATFEPGARLKRIVGRRVGEQRIGPRLD